VAVNESTGHVFVPCPQLAKVFVLTEGDITVQSLESIGILEVRKRNNLVLVVAATDVNWETIDVGNENIGLGEEGIATDAVNNRVYITNGYNNNIVILEDGQLPTYEGTVSVGDVPQGISVNELTQRVYVGNTGDNTVTVLEATSPYTIVTTIFLPTFP
jgi:DNA-binding beta-propeller fold protein YncE